MQAEDAVAVDRASSTPKIVSVLLAGRILEMSFDSVLASMATQLVSRSAIPPGLTYYGTFQLYQSDIEQYLIEMFAAKPDHQVDLFNGSWVEQFFAWKSEKNKPFCKDLVVTFPDGSEWNLRAIDVATLRAEKLFDEKEDVSPEEFMQARDKSLEDDEDLLIWASTYLTWEDVAPYAEETRRPQPETDYSSAWQTAPKRMQPWDDGSYVLGWPHGTDGDDLSSGDDPDLSGVS
jgi:hypothetical protein